LLTCFQTIQQLTIYGDFITRSWNRQLINLVRELELAVDLIRAGQANITWNYKMNLISICFWRTAKRLCAVVFFFLCLPFTAGAVQTQVQAQAELTLFQVTNPEDQLIPQYLLPCIHTAEVQTELAMTESQREKVESILQKLDVRWWPARILELSSQRSVVSELEAELLQKLISEFPIKTVQRLQQLELQAQWPRMILRPEIAEKIGLSTDNQEKIVQLAKDTEKKLAEIADSLKSNPKQDFSSQISTIRTAENDSVVALLTDTQEQVIHNLLGERLNFSGMERIYPMAPELIPTKEWVGNPTTLNSLRGKVVLVHFYAFQCINCRNNFGRYNEWATKFDGQDVAILGIQTPETSSEANPALVREAAQKDGLEFPVLVDLDSQNWKAWGNTMWPTVYVIDKRGYIRFWWQGELNWQGATGDQKIVELVNKLLKE
jgi:peroxiredoxin